jgi:DNA polymerase III subunit delta
MSPSSRRTSRWLPLATRRFRLGRRDLDGADDAARPGTLYRSAVRRVASYNVIGEPFATLIAEQDAERRAAVEVSREIRTLLTIFFENDDGMKVPPQQAQAFCSRPDPAVGLVLLYGPDQGLVAERRRQLIQAVLDQPDDPFRLAELPMDKLGQAPGLLLEEAQAMSLIGGRRVVLVRQATDGLAKAWMPSSRWAGTRPWSSSRRGELGTSSPLRRARREGQDCGRHRLLPGRRSRPRRRAARALARAAARYRGRCHGVFASHVGANRELTRGEVAKLALYKGEEAGRITLADVEAVVGNSSALGIDRLVWAGLVGRPGDAARGPRSAAGRGAGTHPPDPRLCHHAHAPAAARARVEAGETPMAVVDSIKPPVHFSQKPSMQRALESWSTRRLEAGLGLALEAELAAKRAQSPDRLLLRRLLLQLRTKEGVVGEEVAGAST